MHICLQKNPLKGPRSFYLKQTVLNVKCLVLMLNLQGCSNEACGHKGSEKVTTDNYVPNIHSHSQKNQSVMEGIKGKVLESSCLWPAAPAVTAPQAILHSSEEKKDSLTICC